MTTACELTVTPVGRDDGTLFSCGGAATVHNAKAICDRARELAELKGPAFLDLSAVESVDGSVVQILAALQGTLARAARPLHLVGSSPSVDAALTLAGLQLSRGELPSSRIEPTAADVAEGSRV